MHRTKNLQTAQCLNSVLNVKAVVAAFNQEKALVGAFSVIVQPVVEPMDRFAALTLMTVSSTTTMRSRLSLTAHTSEQNSSSITIFFLRSSQMATLCGG